MSDVNIPAVASGAFLGFLALLCIVACVPPVTRFLGDLFCCPWRIPFTKKKTRNGDEEMEKNDFPYLAGNDESENIGTPGNHHEYHRMSAAYLSAVSLVDPTKINKEGARMSADWSGRSGEYRMASPSNSDYRQSYSQYPVGYHSNSDMTAMQQHHGQEDHISSSPQQHLQVPAQQYGNWRQPSPDRLHRSANSSPERYDPTYPPQGPTPYDPCHGAVVGEDYSASSPEHYPGEHYAGGYVDVQRPPPSHVHTPPEVEQHSFSHGYFPQPEWEPEDYHHHASSSNAKLQASSERLMGPPRQ